MEIDSILDDDDLDIQILEVKNKKENAPVETKPIIKKSTLKINPVEEHLLKQLHCVHNQIEQAKNNIELIEAVTETTLDNLTAQSSYREDVSSESDNDLYSSTGELYIKEKKNKFYKKRRVLLVQDLWQRVFDNKWIIGLLVESTTS
ncbi:PREDICTED: uncharacterized protein LOC105368200 [Ceratosolen solmsi marchali]|uniref:Uncharacterized protein LOC105368200 n=1 Tax=Ceratosolen solmsi marchali TaxID=326594 RepID=A0AAJ7E2I5_9HYME|nr:PREDICTED: uncharacterized protein LOC105368200 [Ceratosolen solmsi marchali]